ncbi:ABC transporter substrate-binding protein [Parasalinivibrio latis]|uniref:ABC transporter substrate-binding protein n=1 Tax=Parasalinivibrio latis TaxID=2952610 RepID=UPI0030DFEDDF
MTRLNKTCFGLLLFGLAAFAQGEVVIGASKEEADLEVGCMYPLTGASSLWGNDAVVALEMAVNKLLAEPGLPKIRVYVADTMGKQFRSREIALQFVNRGVQVLCGVVNSNIALEVSQIAREHEILFLGAGHSTARLTEGERHPWYFHLNNDASQSSDAGARYLKDVKPELNWKTVSYIGPDYEYGHQIWQTMMANLKKYGVDYQIKDEFYSLLGETDYRLYIEALLADPPDILVSGHWTRDLVSFLEQAQLSGLLDTTHFVNFDTGGGYFVLSRLGDKLPEGLVLSGRSHVNWPETETNRDYVGAFFRQTQRYPTFIAQDAYTVIQVLGAAWQKAEEKTVPGIRNVLPGLTVSLPEDPEGFSSYIDPDSHKIMQYQAVGETIKNFRFSPATRMLGNWKIYPPAETSER